MKILGIDTSNYTTSLSLYDSYANTWRESKRMLAVPKGGLGLRQSQAVFEHVRNVGDLIEDLYMSVPGAVDAIGVSNCPRKMPNSYMPCFLVGETAGRLIAGTQNCPLYSYSHQEGHIAAALYGANRTDLLCGGSFYAFHLSGGTTEGLLLRIKDKKIVEIKCVARSLDLKAGQAIDRIGRMLDLDFPSGPQLDALAQAEVFREKAIHVFHKDGNFSLSGLENLAGKQLQEGKSHSYIASFTIWYIICCLEQSVSYLFKKYGEYPILFCGGVASNTMLKEYFHHRYQAIFAPPEFSRDNAFGVAYLAYLEEEANAHL